MKNNTEVSSTLNDAFAANKGPSALNLLDTNVEVVDTPQKRQTISILWLPVYIIPWPVIFLLIFLTYYALPTPITIKTESLHPNRFIGERAKLLNDKIANIGPKVVGSDESELRAVSFLKSEIAKIKDAASPIHLIDEQIQISSGILEIYEIGSVTYYQGIQNVLVKISPRNRTTAHSLLINTHYDTVSDSPGAGDAGTLVAVMLEVLRVLSQLPNTLQHSVVFLFNGGEESGLIGSYQFITQHSWASDIRVFINIDAGGTGGREILFRSTAHPWLMNYYKGAPHPTASVLIEEIFKAGVIPAVSDGLVFHNYGHLRGLDFAIYRNGYVYHTKHDVPELIPASTFQNTGDNILALTIAVANADELGSDDHGTEDEELIYFDFVNWFMISYTKPVAAIINMVVFVLAVLGILLSLICFSRNSCLGFLQIFLEFVVVVIIQIISITMGAGAVKLLAFLYDKGLRSMSWFSSPWLLVGIYFCPFFFCLGIIPSLYVMFRKTVVIKRSSYVQMFMHAHCLCLVSITLTLTKFGIRSTFIIVVSVIFYTLTTYINCFTRLQLRDRAWIIVTSTGQAIPFMFYSYYTMVVLDMLIPFQALMGPFNNPDNMIAYIVIGVGILMAGFLIPTLYMFKRPVLVMLGFLIVFVAFGIIMLTPVGFPYRHATSPKRFLITHTQRVFYDVDGNIRESDSGYYMGGTDRHYDDYISNFVPRMHLAEKASRLCKTEMMCGLPSYLYMETSFTSEYRKWLPSSSPHLPFQTSLTLLNQTYPHSLNVTRFAFELKGPDHMSLSISPLHGNVLKNLSFVQEPPFAGYWGSRKIYYMNIVYGVDKSHINFYLDIEEYTNEKPSFDIAVVSHFTHHKQYDTQEYKQFLADFPDWFAVTSSTSAYNCWTY